MRDFKTLYTLEERKKIVAYIIDQNIAFATREDMLDEYEESLIHMYESATDLEIQAIHDAWKENSEPSLKDSEPSLKEQEMKSKIEDLYILESKLIFGIVDAEEEIRTFNKDLKQVRELIKNISNLVNIEIKSEILNR